MGISGQRIDLGPFWGHIKNLDVKDLQKPEGAPLPYLESAMKRAAVLTSSPADEVADVWNFPIKERVAAIEPEEAKGVFDRVALARDIPVDKDEATMSSEYANVAETIEEFNQALMNESNIAHVVETISESRRAVLEIRRGNIDEIRSLNYPPPMVLSFTCVGWNILHAKTILITILFFLCPLLRGRWRTYYYQS